MAETDARDLARIFASLQGMRGFEDASFSCPNTDIPIPPHALRLTIVVPDDTDAVLELLAGQLNSPNCVCGSKHTFPIPMIAVRTATGEILCMTRGASGYSERFRDVMLSGVVEFETDDEEDLVRYVLSTLLADGKFNVSPERSCMAGGTAGAAVQSFLRKGQTEAAKAFVVSYLETALAAEDYIAALVFGDII